MTGTEAVALVIAAGVLVRQLVVLGAVVRSARFLSPGRLQHWAERPAENCRPTFFVVVPVLREAAVIADAVAHFEALVHGHAAQLLVVTTAREGQPRSGADTVAAVEQLATDGKFIHLHYPDPHGLKGDQLNYAAAYCASTSLGDVPPAGVFFVCYDVDSRPPLDSLSHFAAAVAANPGASVFHQSSGFEARTAEPTARPWLAGALAQGAALRANRFVTGFEIPRLLNRTPAVGPLKRNACSYVYAHVTGHGLCARLSLLLDLPFPARSPLEDMHYSFYLGSRNVPMVPVTNLDRAEVPASVAGQVDQATRWFFGPARALRYLRDPLTRSGLRARLMAASALGSSMEWLGCAVTPVATLALIVFGSGGPRLFAAAVTASYLAQLLITNRAVGSPASPQLVAVRLLTCPIATTLFGVGGLLGAVRLMRGGSGVGKTERQ